MEAVAALADFVSFASEGFAETEANMGIIFDDEEVFFHGGVFGESGFGWWGGSERQEEGELASAVGAWLVGNLASVFFGKALGESESEATALDATGEGIMGAVKGVENFSRLIFGDTEAAVEDAEFKMIVLEAGADFQLFIFARIFFCIRNQVDENLGEGIGISEDWIRWRSGVPVGSEAIFFEVQFLAFPDSGDYRMEVD